MTDANTSPSPHTEWYFSRGDAELYDKCPRARFNRTILEGRGVIKVGSSFELSLGRIVHHAIENILIVQNPIALKDAALDAADRIEKVVANGEVPKKILPEFHEQFTQEARCLAEGLIWAWGLHVWPSIKANYHVHCIETQAAYRREWGETYMVLPTVADVVLQSKDDGSYVYPDWKTAAWVNGAWMDSWNRAAQLHTTALAVEQALGEEVEYCYIQALVKGRWQNGYQQSPLCWAYQHTDTGEWRYKYTAGNKWQRTPMWSTGTSMEDWIRNMPQEIAMNLVPRTPPIIIDRDLAETWWRQRVVKEERIKEGKEKLLRLGVAPNLGTGPRATGTAGAQRAQAIMDVHFPQHFDQCAPVIGFRCDYYDVCHSPTIGDDPIGSGLYRRRPTYAERIKEEGTQ